MAGNYTTVIEHKKITIIPFVKLQIRGLGILILILGIHIPIFLITLFLPGGLSAFFMVLTILSCLGSFALAENTNRDREDHISPSRKFYYSHIKKYHKINVQGSSYYLRGRKTFVTMEIERGHRRWHKIIRRS